MCAIYIFFLKVNLSTLIKFQTRSETFTFFNKYAYLKFNEAKWTWIAKIEFKKILFMCLCPR